MLDRNTLRPGDIISHHSWSPSGYVVTAVETNRFYVDMGGSQPNGFPYFPEFFLVESKTREKKKSGFGRWISQHD